jgi:hypothetical protein
MIFGAVFTLGVPGESGRGLPQSTTLSRLPASLGDIVFISDFQKNKIFFYRPLSSRNVPHDPFLPLVVSDRP